MSASGRITRSMAAAARRAAQEATSAPVEEALAIQHSPTNIHNSPHAVNRSADTSSPASQSNASVQNLVDSDTSPRPKPRISRIVVKNKSNSGQGSETTTTTPRHPFFSSSPPVRDIEKRAKLKSLEPDDDGPYIELIPNPPPRPHCRDCKGTGTVPVKWKLKTIVCMLCKGKSKDCENCEGRGEAYLLKMRHPEHPCDCNIMHGYLSR